MTRLKSAFRNYVTVVLRTRVLRIRNRNFILTYKYRMSLDVHSYLGIHGYLTEGCTLCGYVPGWSMDIHNYLDIQGFRFIIINLHEVIMILKLGLASFVSYAPCKTEDKIFYAYDSIIIAMF